MTAPMFEVEEYGYLGESGMLVHRRIGQGSHARCGEPIVCRAPADWRERTDSHDYRPCARCWDVKE